MPVFIDDQAPPGTAHAMSADDLPETAKAEPFAFLDLDTEIPIPPKRRKRR